MESRLEEKKENELRIVTLHLISSPKSICCGLFSPKQAPPNAIIKELYSKFLKDDPLFHFFFEPDLILRISSNTVLENIKNYLKLKQIDFVTYDYPTPAPCKERYCYGESQGGPVIERLYDVYLPLFHLNAIAALTMNKEDHFIYMERTNHTMCNMAGDSRHEEAEKLLHLAELKAEKQLTFSSSAIKRR